MEKEKKIIVIIILNFILFVSLISLAILNEDYFYEMKLTNCKSILNSEYQISTNDVAFCYKLNNYPFWNFTVDYYICYGFLYLILGFILNFTSWLLISEDYL